MKKLIENCQERNVNMITNIILLIDNRDIMAVKYKKIQTKNNFAVFHLKDLHDSSSVIIDNEPEIILISDSLNTKMSQNIEYLRSINTKTRPCIIALSKSNDPGGERVFFLAPAHSL